MSDNGTAIAITESDYRVFLTNNYTQTNRTWQYSKAQTNNHNLAVAVSVDRNVWVTLFFASCNIDCSTLYALDFQNLYKSTDGGKFFKALYGIQCASSVFTSRDATRAEVLESLKIYLSTNSGISFNTIPSPPNLANLLFRSAALRNMTVFSSLRLRLCLGVLPRCLNRKLLLFDRHLNTADGQHDMLSMH